MAPVPPGSTRGPRARALGPVGPLCAQARGLRHPSSSWGPWRGGAPVPPPHAPCPPARRPPCAAGQTQTARGRWRGALRVPSALGGSPDGGQRVSQVALCPHDRARARACPGPDSQRACLLGGASGCPRRPGRSGAAFPGGLSHASGAAPGRSSATPSPLGGVAPPPGAL